MNPDFLRVIAANPDNRRGLFLATANRLGTPLQNVEKDFWVSWVLDLLFNGRDADEPHSLMVGKDGRTAPPLLEADRVTQSENGLEMFVDPDHLALDSLRVDQVYIDLWSGN